MGGQTTKLKQKDAAKSTEKNAKKKAPSCRTSPPAALVLHPSRCCSLGIVIVTMKTGSYVLSAAVLLAAAGSVNAFVASPRNSLAARAAVSPLNMVATEPEIVNGEIRPRKTREVCSYEWL